MPEPRKSKDATQIETAQRHDVAAGCSLADILPEAFLFGELLVAISSLVIPVAANPACLDVPHPLRPCTDGSLRANLVARDRHKQPVTWYAGALVTLDISASV